MEDGVQSIACVESVTKVLDDVILLPWRRRRQQLGLLRRHKR